MLQSRTSDSGLNQPKKKHDTMLFNFDPNKIIKLGTTKLVQKRKQEVLKVSKIVHT